MKKLLHSITVVLLLLVGCRCGGDDLPPPHPPPLPIPLGTPTIRVLLGRFEEGVTLECERAVCIRWNDGKRVIGTPIRMTFSHSDGRLIMNGERVGTKVVVEPRIDGTLRFNGRRYRGSISVFVLDDRICVLNRVPLECYVAGVVGSEMGANFHLSALAAQAIAARTYALYRMERSTTKDWDITSGPEAQMYGGVDAESERVRSAVQSTVGSVLTYNGRIFEAFYHSTCGGFTSSAEFVFGGNFPTPLKGNVECHWCEKSPYFEWEFTASEEEILRVVASTGVNASSIERIDVAEKDAVGRGRFVEILTDMGMLRMSMGRFRASLGYNSLRSALFAVEKKDRNFLFKGRGWGHGVGMCQWGAQGMAKLLFSTQEILNHYYPGSEITRIY